MTAADITNVLLLAVVIELFLMLILGRRGL